MVARLMHGGTTTACHWPSDSGRQRQVQIANHKELLGIYYRLSSSTVYIQNQSGSTLTACINVMSSLPVWLGGDRIGLVWHNGGDDRWQIYFANSFFNLLHAILDLYTLPIYTINHAQNQKESVEISNEQPETDEQRRLADKTLGTEQRSPRRLLSTRRRPERPPRRM